MAKHHDLGGQRFGRLTITTYAGVNSNRQAMWNATCECGNETVVLANKVRRGMTKSCGCEAANTPLDLTGQRFGRLTVLRRTTRGTTRAYKWLCSCDCGSEVEVAGPTLKIGHTVSCGCAVIDHISLLNRTHGLSNTRTYDIWSRMKQRCGNPNTVGWADYGGRGITVCLEWQESFETFLRDMGEAPKGLTIERKDNNLGYSKDNCKWATRKEQNMNKRPRKDLKILPDGRRVRFGGPNDTDSEGGEA